MHFKKPNQTLPAIIKKQSDEETNGFKSAVKSIIHAIRFLAKQGIAFWGHRDNFSEINNNSKNSGNFLEIINLIALSQPALKNHLSHGPKNSRYTSPELQNKVINIISDLINDNIKKRLGNGPYGLIFDETTDRGTTEQICFIISYFDTIDLKIREDFLGFEDAYQQAACLGSSSLTGNVLAKFILNFLDKNGLKRQNPVSITTKTCTTMSSPTIVACAEIKKAIPHATISYCLNHIINLSLLVYLLEMLCNKKLAF